MSGVVAKLRALSIRGKITLAVCGIFILAASVAVAYYLGPMGGIAGALGALASLGGIWSRLRPRDPLGDSAAELGRREAQAERAVSDTADRVEAEGRERVEKQDTASEDHVRALADADGGDPRGLLRRIRRGPSKG